MNKNYYIMSYPRLALLLLPTMLRENLTVAFLTALVRPLTILHGYFDGYINSIDTSVNSQICYMTGLLNDRYDYYDRRIIIRDAPINYDDFFLFTEGDGNASLLADEGDGDPVFWVDSGKLGTTVPDFEIVFPKGYVLSDSEEKQLKQIVNINKLASKKYRIVYE